MPVSFTYPPHKPEHSVVRREGVFGVQTPIEHDIIHFTEASELFSDFLLLPFFPVNNCLSCGYNLCFSAPQTPGLD